jgi:hypothetical protein
VTSRLDGETRKSFELQQNAQVFPKWQDTVLFLQKCCQNISTLFLNDKVNTSFKVQEPLG